jgi:hypothetical protein
VDNLCDTLGEITLSHNQPGEARTCGLDTGTSWICFYGHGTANLNAYCDIYAPNGTCLHTWAGNTTGYWPGPAPYGTNGYFIGVVCGFRCSYVYEFFNAVPQCTLAAPGSVAATSSFLHLD